MHKYIKIIQSVHIISAITIIETYKRNPTNDLKFLHYMLITYARVI